MPFVGIGNYVRALFRDSVFYISLRNTFLITGIAVIVEFILGLGLALLFNRKVVRKVWPLLLSIILLPVMIPRVANGIMWKMLLNPQWGLVNNLLAALGFTRVDLLGSARWALLSLIGVDIWQWTPLVVLLIFSGLKNIPSEYYEAAAIDGASSGQMFIFLTLPQLKWAITFTILIRTIDCFQLFDYVYAITGGGPGYATTTLSYYAYLQGFQSFNLGYGATLGFLILVLGMGIAMVYMWLMKTKKNV